MKTLKVIGVAFLVVWMGWVSLTLIQIKAIALETCAIATVHGLDSNGGLHIPAVCPDLDYNEIKQGKSN